MRFLPLALVLLLCPPGLWAQDQDRDPTLAERLVPGLWQMNQGDPVLGSLAMGGTLATLAPLFVPDGTTGHVEHWVERDGLHYVTWNDPAGNDYQSLRGWRAGAVTLGLWGGLFSTYASYDLVHRRDAHPSLGEMLASPFTPEQVFNWDVIPMVPLLEMTAIAPSDWGKMRTFFDRPSVNWLGWRVSPAAGLGLTAASSMVLVAANATVEEITFRGLYLDTSGVIGSSVIFGANHLVNAFVLPNFSLEEAGWQSVHATLFGLYAASRTEAHGGDFRRMIALHFWHNVATFVLAYLVDPEQAQLFTIAVPL